MCVLEDLYRRYSGESPEAEFLRRGNEMLEKEDYHKALGYFDAAGNHPQTSAEALEGKLKALFALESYEDAGKCIDRALLDFPENTVAYNYKALLLAREDRLDEAIECFDRIISISPADENAYLAKSELLVKKGDFKNASRVAEDLLSQHPESEAANFQAAKAFFGLKEYDKAINLFGKVVRMNPDNDKAALAQDRSIEKYRRSERTNCGWPSPCWTTRCTPIPCGISPICSPGGKIPPKSIISWGRLIKEWETPTG